MVPTYVGPVVYLNMNDGSTHEIETPSSEIAEQLVFVLNDAIADAVFRLHDEENALLPSNPEFNLRLTVNKVKE